MLMASDILLLFFINRVLNTPNHYLTKVKLQ